MADHRRPRRYVGYHLMVAGLLGAVALTAACTDDPAPAPKPAVEVVTPQPEPTPVPPAEADTAPAEAVEAAAVTPEPAEEEIPEAAHTGVDRGIWGPEDCDTANTTTPMTQAEWAANCSDWDNSVTTPEEEDLPGYDYYPEDEEVGCIGYGCSPEQDALLDEAEAAANAGF